MELSKKLVTFLGLAITILTSCSEPNLLRSSELSLDETSIEITYPSSLDGELDTGWEYFLSLEKDCVSMEPYVCELYSRVKRDTYLSQMLLDAVVNEGEPEEVMGISREDFDSIQKHLSDDNTRWLEAIVEN